MNKAKRQLKVGLVFFTLGFILLMAGYWHPSLDLISPFIAIYGLWNIIQWDSYKKVWGVYE